MNFSVIVPIYNVEKYLPECIESILNQSYHDFELILVNDGSKDNCLSICKKYAEEDKRIKVINKENGGLVSARKAGCNVAHGDYVICVDGDDFISQGFFSYANKILTEFNTDFLALGYVNFDGASNLRVFNGFSEGLYNGEKYLKLKNAYIYNKEDSDLNWGSLIFSIWSKVVRRNIYIESQMLIPDDIVLGEDMLCNANIINRSHSTFISTECFYNYRNVQNSMMRSFNMDNFEKFSKTIDELKKMAFIEENVVSVFAYRSLINQTARFVKVVGSYSEFKRKYVETYKLRNLWSGVKQVKIYKTSIKYRIQHFLFSHKILYAIYKYYKK